MKRAIFGVVGVLIFIFQAQGQDINDDMFDLSLEELMNIEIDVTLASTRICDANIQCVAIANSINKW